MLMTLEALEKRYRAEAYSLHRHGEDPRRSTNDTQAPIQTPQTPQTPPLPLARRLSTTGVVLMNAEGRFARIGQALSHAGLRPTLYYTSDLNEASVVNPAMELSQLEAKLPEVAQLLRIPAESITERTVRLVKE